MVPASPIPVAVLAVVVGLSAARVFGDGPAAVPPSAAAAHVVPAVATVGLAVVVWTTPVDVWLWAIVAVVAATAALGPPVDALRSTGRTPTPDEEARLAAVPDRDGVAVRVVPARGRVNGYAVGGPFADAVGVSEVALATLSPEAVAALVAHERGHLAGRHVLVRGAASVTWLAAGALVVSATVAGSAATAAAVGVLVAGERVLAAAVARRTEYAADAHAARRTSPEAVVALLETLDGAAGPRRRLRLRAALSSHPTYRQRIDRLEPRAE